MKKTIASFVFVALALSAGLVSAEPLEKMAKRLAKDMKENKIQKVAVLDFQYHDGARSSGSSIVQERLTTFMAATGKVEVIERNLIKKLLEERKLELTGIIDPQTTRELGKILGVPVVITGTLNDLPKNETEVNARAVDTESGKILSAAKTEIDRTWTDAPVKPTPIPSPVTPVTPAPVTPTPVTPGPSGQFLGKPLVQIAILLDTSNSMDGLINQARAQIWRIINEFVSSEQKGKNPEIQVALYEYGNSTLPESEGYIRQLTPLTSKLDTVSEMLFALKTNGGAEYCGMAVKEAVEKLAWSPYADVYKAIFIAGNEPFTQGPVSFAESMQKAAAKNIFVNTIYCGDRQRGVAEQWLAAATAAGGDYSNINQEVQSVYVAAPQDDEISALSAKLDRTQVPMGAKGVQQQAGLGSIRAKAASVSRAAAMDMSSYRASEQNSKSEAEWDAVAAIASGAKKASDIKKEELPESLRKLPEAERVKKLDEMAAERKAIQGKIAELNLARQKYLSDQQKAAAKGGAKTLEQAVLDTIRKQGSQKGLKFKAN